MDADDVAGLLPPLPPGRELPRRAAHRAALLAAAAPHAPDGLEHRGSWPSARRVLVPLAAAAAVIGVVLAVVMLPLDTAGTHSTRPGRMSQNTRPAFRGSGSLPAPRHWQVPLATITRVVVHSGSGSVTVEAQLPLTTSPARSSAMVTATPAYHGVAPVVTTTVRGATLTIDARCLGRSGPHCGVSLAVSLPATMPVTASSQLSDVTVSGMQGAVIVRNDLGDIWLRDVGGPVTATTDLGDIDGSGLTCARASLTDNLGDISVSFAAPPSALTATDQDGDVSVQVPSQVSYYVTAHSQLGLVSVSVPRSSGKSAALADHLITATSQLGDVTIRS